MQNRLSHWGVICGKGTNMASWKDILEKETDLYPTQQALLLQFSQRLSFGKAISEQGVSLLVQAKDGHLLLSGALDNGHTGMVQKYEVPIDHPMQQILSSGKSYAGIMDWEEPTDTGATIESYYAYAYPIVDNGGKCIGACAFTNPVSEVYSNRYDEFMSIVSQTTFQGMLVPQLQQPELYEGISVLDGILFFEQDGTILYANRAAKKLGDIFGIDRRLQGTSIYSSTLKVGRIKKALEDRVGTIDEELYGDIALRQVMIPVVLGVKWKRGILVLQDKTELRKRDQELLVKNSVIKEVHHRVKNNLQSVAGLLRMQSRRSGSDDVKQALQDSIHRIESMALVHEIVSNFDEDYVALRSIIEELWRLLRQGLGSSEQRIDMEYTGDDIIMSSHKASYVSLVLNELFSNLFKHAFKSRTEGQVQVEVREVMAQGNRAMLHIVIRDTGCGLPEDFEDTRQRRLGLQIIENLVRNELDGSISWSSQGMGTVVDIWIHKGEEYARLSSR